jgi:hypothetical protein
MLFSNAPQYVSRTILLFVTALIVLNACVGNFETKPALTARCGMDWQGQAGIQEGDIPDAIESKGLHVLVWNIHDRLLADSLFSSDAHTEGEVACIGDLASRYDLVLFQEAFVRPAQLARYTGHTWADHPVFSEGGGGDWWPLRMMCDICLSPGLLMLAREAPESVHAEPYETFAGWNTDLNKADDFFSKGFQLVQFPTFWALNSHMDAGRGQDSIDARTQQLRQMTTALKRLVPDDAPLLIGMDANLRPDVEEQDEKILQEFLEANRLTLVHQKGPDLIAVRSMLAEHYQSLPLKGILSDHNALSAIIGSVK